MEQNRRYTDIISTKLPDNDRLAMDQHHLAMKSLQTNTPVDDLVLGKRKNEDDKYRELLRAGAKTRLLELAGIGKENQQEESTDSPRKTERPLTPEQKEMVQTRLKERFEAKENQALYADTGITWGKVEEAMGDEDLKCAYMAEQLGHEPAIFMADDGGFWFGTRTNETPQSTRNCVLDEEAAEPLRKRFPGLRSAVKSAEDMRFDRLMTTNEGDHIAKNTKPYYEKDWSCYETPEDVRKAGNALDGSRRGGNLGVLQFDARSHGSGRGWRGTRRVLYKKAA